MATTDEYAFASATQDDRQFSVWMFWREGPDEIEQQFGYGDNRRTQWLVGQALAQYPERHLRIRELDNGA